MSDSPENLQVIKLEPTVTPEKTNIRERLNLHVKRRLQQDVPTGTAVGDEAEGSKKIKVNQPKEVPKVRKPYQKRTEKNKTENNKFKKAQIASPAVEPELPPDDGQELDAAEASETKTNNRDRYKNADILNMVLSVKKRALLQHPEVQEFWMQIMSAIKS